MSRDTEMRQTPHFVVGALRSGTTMLRLMLNAHPDVCHFGEFEYAVRFAQGDQFPTVPQYVQYLDADLGARTDGFVVDATLNYTQLVRSFLEQARERSGKELVGATVHSRFDLLPDIWPTAKIIHLVRDPRDVSRSCIGMGWVGNVWYGAEYWIAAEQRWNGLQRRLPSGSFITVCYEDLVKEPSNELAKICEFLGVPYAEEMLSYPTSTSYSAPDKSLVEQWRKKLTPGDIRLVETRCGQLMTARGYQQAYGHCDPGWMARCRLAVQNRTARWAFNLKRYGLPLYLQWQIAKRMPLSRSGWSHRVLRNVDRVQRRAWK